MTSHFLKDFSVYKRLYDFTVKGFERINLITGKNNVGKTTFLEMFVMNAKSSPHAVGFISDDAIEVFLEHPFHRSHLYLVDIFDKLLAEGNLEKLDKLLNDFNTNISRVYIRNNTKLVTIDKNGYMFDITGKGFLQYIKIISALYTCENGYLCIDDIANGIHHSQLDKLWETLFKLAIEHNIQIFSSTHSLEMIKAFAKAAKNFPEQAAYFEMARNPRTGLIKAVRHDISTLCFELDRNIGIRGE